MFPVVLALAEKNVEWKRQNTALPVAGEGVFVRYKPGFES
jgi:hypothetical protein